MLSKGEMAQFKYNPHNLFKAIVYLDKHIIDKELMEKVKLSISSYFKEYR